MSDEEYNKDEEHEDVEPEGEPQPVDDTTPEDSELQTPLPDQPVETPDPASVPEGKTNQPEE